MSLFPWVALILNRFQLQIFRCILQIDVFESQFLQHWWTNETSIVAPIMLIVFCETLLCLCVTRAQALFCKRPKSFLHVDKWLSLLLKARFKLHVNQIYYYTKKLLGKNADLDNRFPCKTLLPFKASVAKKMLKFNLCWPFCVSLFKQDTRLSPGFFAPSNFVKDAF